jgi:hypothetical protein
MNTESSRSEQSPDIHHLVIPVKAHARQLKDFCSGIPDGTLQAMIRVKTPNV